MAAEGFPLNAVLDTHRQVHFGMTDLIRRAQGHAFGAFGLDPIESPYRVLSGPFWRLRDYGGRDTGQSLLIVAAPINRPYIWDLAPSASAIRYILGHNLHVHLLEWLPASQATGKNGLTEYAKAISECVARISSKGGGLKPFLIGHSLGGTLAAIFGAFASESIPGSCCLVHRCASGPRPVVSVTRWSPLCHRA